MSADLLPPFLNNTEPLEPEDLPLQVALLTMELARQWETLAMLSALLTDMGQRVRPPGVDL